MEKKEEKFEELSAELFQPIPEEELQVIKGGLSAATCPTVTPKANHNDAD